MGTVQLVQPLNVDAGTKGTQLAATKKGKNDFLNTLKSTLETQEETPNEQPDTSTIKDKLLGILNKGQEEVKALSETLQNSNVSDTGVAEMKQTLDGLLNLLTHAKMLLKNEEMQPEALENELKKILDTLQTLDGSEVVLDAAILSPQLMTELKTVYTALKEPSGVGGLIVNSKTEPFIFPKKPNADLVQKLETVTVSQQNTNEEIQTVKDSGQAHNEKAVGESLKNMLSDQSSSNNSDQQKEGTAKPLVFNSGPMNKVQQFLLHTKNDGDTSVQQQIMNQIKAVIGQGQLKNLADGSLQLTVKLNPEHLGGVQVVLQQTDEGIVATLTAQSTATKDLIQSQLTHLKHSLAASGLNFHKIDVFVADSTPSGNAQQDNHSQQDQQQQERESQHSQGYYWQDSDDELSDYSFEEWLTQREGVIT